MLSLLFSFLLLVAVCLSSVGATAASLAATDGGGKLATFAAHPRSLEVAWKAGVVGGAAVGGAVDGSSSGGERKLFSTAAPLAATGGGGELVAFAAQPYSLEEAGRSDVVGTVDGTVDGSGITASTTLFSLRGGERKLYVGIPDLDVDLIYGRRSMVGSTAATYWTLSIEVSLEKDLSDSNINVYVTHGASCDDINYVVAHYNTNFEWHGNVGDFDWSTGSDYVTGSSSYCVIVVCMHSWYGCGQVEGTFTARHVQVVDDEVEEEEEEEEELEDEEEVDVTTADLPTDSQCPNSFVETEAYCDGWCAGPSTDHSYFLSGLANSPDGDMPINFNAYACTCMDAQKEQEIKSCSACLDKSGNVYGKLDFATGAGICTSPLVDFEFDLGNDETMNIPVSSTTSANHFAANLRMEKDLSEASMDVYIASGESDCQFSSAVPFLPHNRGQTGWYKGKSWYRWTTDNDTYLSGYTKYCVKVRCNSFPSCGRVTGSFHLINRDDEERLASGGSYSAKAFGSLTGAVVFTSAVLFLGMGW